VPSNPCTSTHTHTHIHAHTHQAWACSKPVVVTQKGGPGELVHNGKDGIKV
jgi:glycosyltransferase involved in cell wall biosynthesis